MCRVSCRGKIDESGKAGRSGDVREGDRLLGVNDVFCRNSHAEALRLIESASQIDESGKAGRSGDVREGDRLLGVNDVFCRNSHAEALRLIESAFRTLTLTLWRSGSRIRAQGWRKLMARLRKQPPAKAAIFLARVNDFPIVLLHFFISSEMSLNPIS
ncbi:unnamed protein product [Notodromas monacha]|uniref:PDZ domain-containing protein n=1 Tax=Notodromas monacha TaxID=399045 RepID=A0A7R9GA72_9CRUS|nr:unnamed protein product [Notodromas monacha]CAG0913803.1 unnamed protein product [Notodromas monacha]